MRSNLAHRLGCPPAVIDRLAVALAIAHRQFDGPATAPHPDIDAFNHGPALRLALAQIAPMAPLADAVGAGHRLLGAILDAHPTDLDAALAELFAGQRDTNSMLVASGALPVPVAIGEDGTRILWDFNQEQGSQTNANTRIVGQPGMGKTQFLMHLLASLNQHADTGGLLLLDYKGDLASNGAFCQAVGATVVRPEQRPIPINPFSVPAELDPRLVSGVIAANIAALGRGIGEVQRRLLRIGIDQAFEQNKAPTAIDIAQSVWAVYENENRKPDSVISLLEQLAELGLFATSDTLDFERFAAGRYLIDLSGLQTLRDLVAFSLLDWFARQAESAPDAPFGDGHRQLRTTLVIDEAHHYIRQNIRPLQTMLRVGRSKGVPVILSSQSLEDFKGTTELEEFLPTTFVLRQGIQPDTRTVQSALRLSAEDIARVKSLTTTLEQFEALACLQGVASGSRLRLHAFFEEHWKTRGQT